MGGASTKVFKKSTSTFTPAPSVTNEKDYYKSEFTPNSKQLVLIRRGSMFFDEDGDLAHEFYVEVLPQSRRGRPTLQRVTESLRPQGDVPLPFPRLPVDFPLVIYQVEY